MNFNINNYKNNFLYILYISLCCKINFINNFEKNYI